MRCAALLCNCIADAVDRSIDRLIGRPADRRCCHAASPVSNSVPSNYNLHCIALHPPIAALFATAMGHRLCIALPLHVSAFDCHACNTHRHRHRVCLLWRSPAASVANGCSMHPSACLLALHDHDHDHDADALLDICPPLRWWLLDAVNAPSGQQAFRILLST